MAKTTSPAAFFVYGTLRRGGCREKCWPAKPISVSVATTRGHLFDLGPYPALTAGEDLVAGELWQFDEADLPAVIQRIDAVEGFADQPGDLYKRVVVTADTEAGPQDAFVYFYAHPGLLPLAQRVRPADDGLCRWLETEEALTDLEAQDICENGPQSPSRRGDQ